MPSPLPRSAGPRTLGAVLLILASPAAANAVFMGSIYWSDGTGHIKRFDGRTVETVLTADPGYTFGGIALVSDSSGSPLELYSGDQGHLFRANPDGTGRVDLVPTVYVGDVEVDRFGGKVYWVDAVAEIHRADLDGGHAETLITRGAQIDGLAVDPVGGKLYWSEDDSIWVANLDGTGAAVSRALPAGSDPQEVEIDTRGGMLYWNEPDGLLRRARLNGRGSIQNILSTAPNGNSGLSVDPSSKTIFFTLTPPAGRPPGLYQANLNGSGLGYVLNDADGINYVEGIRFLTAVVPEPASFVLAGVGAAGAAAARWRARARNRPATG
ncbi:MAG: PEP-CTERM sorting domain-containing protein [Gemmataceae bacterium]|nr:PEP-CTERM sorting domain-containing protein [Gemmataceae bacterium]